MGPRPLEQSPTFSALAELGQRVVFTCMVGTQHYTGGGILNLSAAEAAERFGSDIKVEAVRRRLRCRGCGHRGPRIMAEVYEPMSAAHRARWSRLAPRPEPPAT